MAEWRYVAQRLNGDGTATFLDFDVPLSEVEIEDVLSGTNGLSGRVAPEVLSLKNPDGTPIFQEWSTAIFAESEGNIHGGGILTHSEFDGSEWGIECSGFTGYLKEMPYTGNGAHYVETDTLDIVRDIWAHVQGQNGGNLGLVLDQTKSGLLVGSELESPEYDPEGGAGGLTLQSQAYKLAWYQDHDLESNFNSLAEDTPFDYHERHYWDGEEIAHSLHFGVPRIGGRREDLQFVIGENVFVKPSVSRAGEDYADEVFVLGAGEGAKMIRGHSSTVRTRLRRVSVASDSSLRRVWQANSAAASELKWRQRLDDFTSVVVREHPHAEIGSVQVGDEVFIEGNTGWVEVGVWCRVLARRIRPDSQGSMELSLVRVDRLAA